ncbi:MAG: radical SAM protein, partial [Thermoplasmata archaeon]|nr:radical SAM protein [Thermoplasmata archaeon]
MMYLRASIGSMIALGLKEGRLPAYPTTLYLMLGRSCRGGCLYCAQSRTLRKAGGGEHRLSRLFWPPVSLGDLVSADPGEGMKRVCIQTLDYPGMEDDLLSLVGLLRDTWGLPISVSVTPLSGEVMERLRDGGVDRLGISLDAANRTIFDRVRGKEVGGRWSWDDLIGAMEIGVGIYGRGRVTNHLIIGLGENDREVLDLISSLRDMGVV